MTARIVPDDAAGRIAAVAALRAGGIVALPTDTVYGIAADPGVAGSIEQLFVAKDRPADRAIVLLLADAAQADEVAILAPAARCLAEAGWPGGLTLVVRRRPDVALPPALTGDGPTIGLRVPDHACPRELARAIGPLPTTSANLSGRPTPPDAAGILAELGERIELIVDGGPAAGGPPSTVVDCTADRPRILRAGAVPAARLAGWLEAAGFDHDLG